jgi:inner membrane protein
MASIFGHAALGFGLAKISQKKATAKIILLCIFCTVIPDADVLMFFFGVPYESAFGHRGFTHSIFFALDLGLLISFLFCRKKNFSVQKRIGFFLLFFGCTISHGLLDAMTTRGGLGVEFFFPFDNSRYYFPFRPIKVSPLGVSGFFSEWGLTVLKSEAIWIGIPSLVLVVIRALINFFAKTEAAE